MFGDTPIKGKCTVITQNNSIKLPSFSQAEPKETLCFLYLPDEIRLYSEKEYTLFIKKMLEICKKEKLGTVESNNIKRYIAAKGYDEGKVSRTNKIKSLKGCFLFKE